MFLIGVIVAGLFLLSIWDDISLLKESADKKIALINDGTFKDKTETVIFDTHGEKIASVDPRFYTYVESEAIQLLITQQLVKLQF